MKMKTNKAIYILAFAFLAALTLAVNIHCSLLIAKNAMENYICTYNKANTVHVV